MGVIDIGKILIITFSDSEEQTVNKILLVMEGTMEYIQNHHSSDILTFLGLEIRIREQNIHHNDILIPLTHHEFFTLLYLAQHPF